MTGLAEQVLPLLQPSPTQYTTMATTGAGL